MVVHFDGDLLVYRCGFACEQSPVEHALHTVKLTVQRTLSAIGCTRDDLVMCISGKSNFRDGVATLKPYKGNRDKAKKPKHGPAIRDYLKTYYDAVVSEDEEADDVVSYKHYALWLKDEYSSCICSVDKDLDMVPGLHYNFVKDESYYITPEQGEYEFMKQLLMGDPTDNIQGIPGVGIKGAENALQDEDKRWHTIFSMYQDAYGPEWEDALLENGRLLWMRLEPDQWWTPPIPTTIPLPRVALP